MLHYLPFQLSSFAGDIDQVIRVIYYIVGTWFVAAEVILFWLIFGSRSKPGVRAAWLPGTGRAKWAVLAPVCAVLACDLIIEKASSPTWEYVKLDIPHPDVEVKIEARQFAWIFTYPGKDGILGTEDDLVAKELHVPVNKKVVFHLEAADVLHNFYVKDLRLKQDAVPGRSIKGWFDTNTEGTYEIACAEICGKGHTLMGSKLVVDSNEAYQSFLAAL